MTTLNGSELQTSGWRFFVRGGRLYIETADHDQYGPINVVSEAGANLDLTFWADLPTSDPSVEGALWLDGQVVTVSGGTQ
jgi:hypothetical protein